MTAANRSRLYDNAEEEHGCRDQNAIFTRRSLSEESSEECTNPCAKLEDRSEPSLLRWVVDVSIRFCYHVINGSAMEMDSLLRAPKDGICKMPLNMPWL